MDFETTDTATDAAAAGDTAQDDATMTRTRERAYEIWEAEGRPHGQHDDHWRRAQDEMTQATDPMTAAILPQSTLLEPSATEGGRKKSAAARARKD